ncbi:MAG: hypothetical protein KBG15_20930 [Kofleriaceae bacterium]|nr:hypothetical protein [Kofleriaceae bacterium]
MHFVRTCGAILLMAELATSCTAAGEYAERDRTGNFDKRGDTNGTMFDMVAMTPDGDQWTVRLRGDDLWVASSLDDRVNDFGTVKLEPKERKKLWKLIDAINIPKRRKGGRDEKNGDVLLKLREPGNDGDEHKLYSVYVSRASEVEAIIELGDNLRDLIRKYHKEKAVF